MGKYFFILFLFCYCSFVRAEEQEDNLSGNTLSITEETDFGSGVFTQNINGGGSFGAEKNVDPPWSWNLGYSYERSSTSNIGAPDIIDTTNTVTGGAGWAGTSGWGTNLSLNFSNTAAESLSSKGATLTLSHLWKADASADEFAPTFTLSTAGGTDTYSEFYTGSVPSRSKKKNARPTAVAGTVGLKQYLIQLEGNLVPSEHWEFDLALKAYLYTHDVASFQNNLDSPKSLQTGASGFAGTVGGLPKANSTGDIKWRFEEDWTNELNGSVNILAIDSTLDTTLKDTLIYKLSNHWRVTGGLQYETSLASTTWQAITALEWDL